MDEGTQVQERLPDRHRCGSADGACPGAGGVQRGILLLCAGGKAAAYCVAGICTALYWLGALGYLFAGRVTSHCVYALVPVIASLLPGAYLVFGLVALAASPGRMTLVQKENGPGRVVRASVGCGLLSSAGAVGCAVFLTVSGQWAGGWSEPLLTAAASAAAWAAFATGRRAYMKIERA